MAKKEPDNIPNINVDIGEDSLTLEESLAKVAMILAKTDSPKVLSEITDQEIRMAAALFVIAKRTKNEMIDQFLENFLLLRVSHKRKGREELLKIAQSAKEGSDSRMSRLRSFFTGNGMR